MTTAEVPVFDVREFARTARGSHYLFTLLVPVALYGAAWILALLGKDPPALLSPLL